MIGRGFWLEDGHWAIDRGLAGVWLEDTGRLTGGLARFWPGGTG